MKLRNELDESKSNQALTGQHTNQCLFYHRRFSLVQNLFQKSFFADISEIVLDFPKIFSVYSICYLRGFFEAVFAYSLGIFKRNFLVVLLRSSRNSFITLLVFCFRLLQIVRKFCCWYRIWYLLWSVKNNVKIFIVGEIQYETTSRPYEPRDGYIRIQKDLDIWARAGNSRANCFFLEWSRVTK